jgi:O-antigen/teichoic acid export membrane protein
MTAFGTQRSAVLGAWRDPVFRGGFFLTLSSTATAVVGLAYWSIVARRYATPVVGRSAATIAAMTLLGGFSQLNLGSALIRFVPGAGRDVRRLVLGAYGVSALVAVVAGSAFITVAGSVSEQFRFVTDRPLIAVGFVASVVAWTVFNLQDGVLTALRLTHLVAVENAVFAVAKVGIVAVLATASVHDGILVSWWLGLLIAVAGTNFFLFRRPLRRHARLPPTGPPIRPGPLARFAVPDYVGGMCTIIALNAMPFLIIAVKGAAATAYFAISWQVGVALFVVSGNMGQSLVVETAVDQSGLPAAWRRMMRHTLLLLIVAVAVVVAIAPYLLRLFGPEYSHQGTTLVRLLVLAAIPNLVVETASFAARSHRRTVVSSAIQAAMCGGVLILGTLLLPLMGVTGIGVAWLVTLTVLAAVLLARPRWWLYAR